MNWYGKYFFYMKKIDRVGVVVLKFSYLVFFLLLFIMDGYEMIVVFLGFIFKF